MLRKKTVGERAPEKKPFASSTSGLELIIQKKRRSGGGLKRRQYTQIICD